ncbi:MAG: FAD-dependent oxidoreductase [Ignavibacteria bacterium]|jgi:hypothetical protein|nr:FAD-dependent oxidoreductase [Ignavibacteria bacterium]MDH7528085.1 FAD-dependent oxidoreductase [Ignavibacteria bacterium]
METSNQYDVIIYPANLSGVVASIFLKKNFKKVLLLNRYGFFGGSITESLNLLQRKPVEDYDRDKVLNSILKRVKEFNEGILFEDDQYILFNPEVVKYVLQKVCEENEIELLFHITPYQVNFTEDLINIIVIGKEGEINFTTSKMFDFSTEFTFAPLIDKTMRAFSKAQVNFISLPVDEKILQNVNRKIRLKDKRWWLSIDLNTQNLFDVEDIATQTLDKIDELLRQNRSRIQIVPAQSHLIFTLNQKAKVDKRISFITDFVNIFEPENEILIAREIEKRLSDEKNF